MATSATVLNTTLTAASTYSSGHLTVGSYTELTYDFHITSLTGTALIIISRVDLFGNLIQIYGSQLPPTAPPISPDTSDIGGQMFNSGRTFGNTIQVDVTVTSGTISGTISIQGKG